LLRQEAIKEIFVKSSLEATVLQAIKQGDLSQLEALVVEHGTEAIRADTNPAELTALHWAAGAGDLKIVRYLMSDAIQAEPGATRINNFTPLHAAAMQGQAEVCQELLMAGVDVNVQTIPQGYAPLHSAAYGGHLEAIKILVTYGANLELRNYRGERPIDTAQRQNQNEVVLFLQEVMSQKS
jgi:ankyrin repeat protein